MQDRLKDLSDNQLRTYVENPRNMQGSGVGQGGTSGGYIPTYLVLGEMKRRKDSRSKYQGEKAQQKTTVADDLITEQGIGNQMTRNPMSQPTAGVGTPQPQEPVNPAMLASKGIGQLNPGAVKEMNDGGIVGYAAGDLVKKAQRNRFLGSELGFEDGPVAYPLLTAAGDAASYLNPLSYMDTYNPKVDSITGKVVGGVGDRFADTNAEIARREREKRDILARMGADEKIEERNVEVAEPLIEDDYTVSSMQEVTENVPGMLTTNVFDRETINKVDSSSNVVPTSMDVIDEVKETVKVDDDGVTDKVTDTVDSKLDIADLDIPDILSKEQQDLFAGRKGNRPTVLSSEDALDQVLATNKKAGLFDNPFNQDRKDLEKERELLDKAKSDAGSMAFIKAGLLWMQKGNLGDAAPAVTEYAQALKGLRGEDRELKKMDLALKGADIAYKQGNIKAASELTSAAQTRLDAFDRDTLSNMNQALIAGNQGRINMINAQLNAKTNLEATGITASKDPAAVALFKEYAKDPLNQKVIEKDGVMVSVPDTAKIAELQRTSTYPPERQITSLGNLYVKQREQLQTAAKTQNPVAVKALELFDSKYPDGAADYIRKNKDIISSGQGSSQGSKFGQPTVVK